MNAWRGRTARAEKSRNGGGVPRFKYGLKPISVVDIRTVDLGPRHATHREELYQALLTAPEGQGVIYRFVTAARGVDRKRSREYNSLATCLKRYFLRRGLDVSMHVIKHGPDVGNALITLGSAPFQWYQRRAGVVRSVGTGSELKENNHVISR